MNRFLRPALVVAVLLFATPVHASCTTPNGIAGDIIFNSTYNVVQFCNGTSWVNAGSQGTSGIGTLTSGDFCNTDGTVINCTTGTISLSSQASGTLQAAQFPALTGDVTTNAGSLATTVAKIQGTTVSGVTGTGNVVLSASPTFTGSVSFPGSGIWNSSGSVGIGTTTPGTDADSSLLTVYGRGINTTQGGSTPSIILGDYGNSTGYVGTENNYPFGVLVNGGVVATFTSTGVGISGNTSISGNLTVSGSNCSHQATMYVCSNGGAAGFNAAFCSYAGWGAANPVQICVP